MRLQGYRHGYDECSNDGDGWKLLGSCGHRGRMVGEFFTITETGEVVFRPPGTRLTSFGGPRKFPLWDPPTLIRNSVDLWRCHDCNATFETTFAPPPTCHGLGTNTVGHKGGMCPDPTAYQPPPAKPGT